MATPHAFRSVLIANRGEIAVRIQRTARRLGMRTIAVYAEADRDAPHCRAADLALPIGPSQPQASYLNIEALLDAARRSGAEAVHPGYGFLAESEAFAIACIDAGLVFIGPAAGTIRAMGNKAAAKRLMHAAGVPCVPGYEGEDVSDARMLREASRIGYPVMVKAAAGGGGRGMRHVERPEHLVAALRSARSEAENAFGSGELILEKAIIEPRHIEIQVFADLHGNIVHLGERDCSVQRRHQKLIEESPSPAVPPELRERMGAVAVAAARAIGYVGAGTLEFLLAPDGAFYFMEMNTRLQVEHAVTEAVLGIDLVEWQLRVAMGETLPMTQVEIDARRSRGGHAIEVRLCAEDPRQDFLPQSGTVVRWRAPGDVRTDHALADGWTVPPYYDSMLAKIVAHGVDRADACRRLAKALEDCLLLGLRTNRAFLHQCVTHPAFVAGDVSTAFIDQHFPAATRQRPSAGIEVRQAAAVLLTHLRSSVSRRYPAELQGWHNSRAHPAVCRFALDAESVDLRVRAVGPQRWEMASDNEVIEAEVLSVMADRLMLRLGETFLAIDYAGIDSGCWFVFDGVEHVAIDTTYARPERQGGQAGNGRISTPMNGRVVALHVAEGDAVLAGQSLLVVEAMKMEHSIAAPFAGAVTGLFTRVGAQVAPGAVLMEIAAS